MRHRVRTSSGSCATWGWWTSPRRVGSPRRRDRQLLLDIEGCTKAAEFLKAFRQEEGRCDAGAAAFASGEEAYEHYAAAQRNAAAIRAEIARLEKAADELRPWGPFDVTRTERLAGEGIVLRYFFTPAQYLRQTGGGVVRTLFDFGDLAQRLDGLVRRGGGSGREEITLDAQEMKTPHMDIREGGAPHCGGECKTRGAGCGVLARGGFGEAAGRVRRYAEGAPAGGTRYGYGAAGGRRHAAGDGGAGPRRRPRRRSTPCSNRIPTWCGSRATPRRRTIRPSS